jgi:cytochrome b561
MLAANNAAAGKTIDGWHQAAEWALLALIVNPVAAALAHLFINRDRFMARMLPG